MNVYEPKPSRKGIVDKNLQDLLKEEIREYCLLEGFDKRIGNRIKSMINIKKQTFESINNMIKTYKGIFDSLGYGAEDFIQYINANPINIEIKEDWFKYDIALLNIMGTDIMESAIFGNSYILYPTTNPIELNAVIKWLTEKDKTDKKRETNVYEIKYYLDRLSREEMGELIKKYPFTKEKASVIISKSEALTASRIRENNKWIKRLK